MTVRVTSRRLDLRPLDPRAAGALPDDRATAAELIGARLPADWPAPDLLDVLPTQAAADPVRAQYGVWVIIERDTETVVGDIGFFGPPGPERTVEIGYSVVADRRGRGYASEAAEALVAWVFEQGGLDAVVAGCREDNESSVRTLVRLGFSRTGQQDGQLRWRCARATVG